MWRYAVGGVAALLMVAAGWMLFHGNAAREPALPPPPLASRVQVDDEAAPGVPEASDRTREQKRFDRYDKDRDGRITREEYLASRRKAFAKLDTNGDGRLSFEEWAVKPITKFADADRDRSGTLDRGEFATTAPKRRPKPKCVCAPAPAAAED
ncbi:EF-hand domain-containing protein [uncultured Sphingomonas sp.]|uniref:EF-hand domain-containing protein n=1 Tax=uncultured Sphingomonas sp. TaxID=158754 RepID=UPI00261C6573|nr:EF-hand domain-containing protein [uncultured Sphingomonas sp.]